MTLAAVADEQQARVCGRGMAKEIFKPMQWKRIGTRPDEDAKLYENVRARSKSRAKDATDSQQRYCLRAVRPLQASIAEVEAVLTAQTAMLRKEGAPPLLARLLPATYVSGGRIARYPQLEHSTSERENVALQYARLRPYTTAVGVNVAGKDANTAAQAVENHVLLGYTLSTRLQRSNTSKKSKGKQATQTAASVPSLLHLFRPVCAPSFAQRRPDFRRERLALNDFSITYIIQETPPAPTEPSAGDEQQNEEPESNVSLEVVLTCSLDPRQVALSDESDEQVKERRQQQKLRLRHDALCLTRLQPFVDAFRQEKQRASLAVSRREQQHDPKDCDPNLLRGSVFAGGRGCGICHRKFSPFRWKRHCETCEKVVCNQCLSVLAAAPSLSRRKKRVCSLCLYGETANVAGMHKAAAAAENGNASAQPAAAPESASMDVFPFPTLETLMANKAAKKPVILTANGNTGNRSTVSGRVDIDLGLDAALASNSSVPPPVPEWRRSSARTRTRQSQRSDGYAVGLRGNDTTENRRATLSGRNVHSGYGSDGESVMSTTMRARRAQTVVLDDVNCKPVMTSSLNFNTPLSTSAPSVPVAMETEDQPPQHQQQTLPRTGSYRSKIQFVQLKTPEPDYDLDFNWYNIFPKAPVDRSAHEKARAQYVEVTGLKVDAHSLVFLRHDAGLEELASRVLEVATQWHGCSISLVASREVYCLVTASNKPEIDLDDELLELEASPVTVDDVIPREESVSSYAVHHRSPFFVAEMEHDPRLRAHPLHTDQGAVSLLSFPIYSSGAGANGATGLSLPSQGETSFCVATLDLWKRDRVPASSHVSQEWVSSMDSLLREIGARLEALARESHVFLKPRSRAGYSVGSSCDSRGSTRRTDSIDIELDLYDIDSESVVDSPPLSHAETMDRLTNLSYAKVRGLGLGGMGGPGSQTWKYDSDNESTTSSQSASSASSQNSRFSSHRYSAADMHSTIESLLQQASQTSKYISETGVSI
ncbi:hypothetical protein BBJ28_00020275 [Nothophytophthora sp. Chile5]|nr:hypothetical protein BBJ28_00020275 [Nothophytophthora sp. Chile5]